MHGWLVLDKPVGMTVDAGRRRRAGALFDARKAGHAGTLDPLATGVLPIALGEATKTVPYAVDGTEALPIHGALGCGHRHRRRRGRDRRHQRGAPGREAIEALLPRFTGEILQTPPAFSAIKVDGDAPTTCAREGETVELRAASRAHRISGAARHAGPRHGRARGPLRQGHLRARARPRYGPCARLPRPASLRLRRTARRPVRRGARPSPSQALEAAAADGGEEARCGCCSRSRPPCRTSPSSASARTTPRACCAGQTVLIRGRDAPTGTGPTYATCKGHLIAVGRIEKGELHPIRVFNFGNTG